MEVNAGLSGEQLEVILDHAPSAILITSFEGRKLLYANRSARELFLGEDMQEIYHAFMDTMAEKRNQAGFNVWEYRHPVNQRIYEINEKNISWSGKKAYIRYIADITEKNQELKAALSSIPCGLGIYQLEGERISPVFCNPAFFEVIGCWEDPLCKMGGEDEFRILKKKIRQAFEQGGIFRENCRLWNDTTKEEHFIHLEGAAVTKEDGKKLLYVVYSDANEQKRLNDKLEYANEKLQNTINAIPGGIAIYKVAGNRFVPTFLSDGVMALSGHSRKEFEEMIRYDVLDIIYELDRDRVLAAAQSAYVSGDVLDISYRMRHKNGNLIWIHFNGRRIGPLSEDANFYAVFTGMSSETRLFQSIADGTADGIYVIDRRNYELLYANELGNLFLGGEDCLGMKCYKALYGKKEPCEFCILTAGDAAGEGHEMEVMDKGRFYRTRFRRTNWNGIPAYVKYVRDVTDEVQIRREKERLEMYFKTVVDKLPGGVSVIRIEANGAMTPEYISDGFAAMTHMTVEGISKLYDKDILAGFHPEDAPSVKNILKQLIEEEMDHCEIIGRMIRGDGDYIWVKNSLSLKRMSDGILRIYCAYTDISKDVEEREWLQSRYEDLIMQHYRSPGPDTLIVGHCNISQNQILGKKDYTGSLQLDSLGEDREKFFAGISKWIVDEAERQSFLNKYKNSHMLSAYQEKNTEQGMKCFIRLPHQEKGCYACFKVNLVEVPDTGDVIGILTVTDITEQTIAERILHQLSVTSHDYIIDLDLEENYYKFLSYNKKASCLPEPKGNYSELVVQRAETVVVPRDRMQYIEALEAGAMRRRLKETDSYTFTYSVMDEKGDVKTKNIAVSSIDLRLGRVCLVSTDITESVCKQQSLLNMIAYTFDLAGLIHIDSQQFTMYTRQTVLENLPPYTIDNYSNIVKEFASFYHFEEDVKRYFSVDTIVERLMEKPSGYDFVLPYQSEGGLRYKQINVMWGDQSHSIICLVRADVTDMLTAERKSQRKLETALAAAEKANQAKSEFLSAMSHDIRTPMNAIMGMTTLAMRYFDNQERVKDCLQKITISSRHLLSLINDVLDMSKIERSQITLNPLKVSLSELIQEISAIITPQMNEKGLHFTTKTEGILHNYFYGDSLRVNQILLNLLSNAVKFTPEDGQVVFLTEEIKPVRDDKKLRYRFTVSDTGIGMPEEFLDHIFDPFARDTSANQIEGTGLGLSITKGLIELMEGDISIKSQLGAGSVFQVELELESAGDGPEQAEKPEGTAASQEMDLSGRYFLVAEDNAINAEILCEILAMYGARAVVKTDGLQVVQEYKDKVPGTYDAILMDIQMPIMNGFEAARAIRSFDREDAATIPIIAMTANAFFEDIQAALEAGMNAHVAKPIDMAMLQLAFQKVLREKDKFV